MPVSVLIVDDEPHFRLNARRLLTLRGFEVAGEAADGAAALDLARSLRPDAVLLDINLPDVNGLDLAFDLSALANPPRVLLVSAAVEPGERLVRECRAVGFLTKDELPVSDLYGLLGGGAAR